MILRSAAISDRPSNLIGAHRAATTSAVQVRGKNVDMNIMTSLIGERTSERKPTTRQTLEMVGEIIATVA